tara:strand:- start:773 stop:1186 length:414 start_codon:yes stop_codon:yes gene_type:complete
MKVIDPNIATSIIKTLPRSFDATVDTSVTLTEEGTNVIQTVVPSAAYVSGNYTVFECEFLNIREDYLYFMEINQSSDTKFFNIRTGKWSDTGNISVTNIYRDKIYATGSSVENHSINTGEYIINIDSDSNEYITYDD